MVEEAKHEGAHSSREVHRTVQADYKDLAEKKGFGPFDEFNGGVDGYLKARLGEEQYSNPNSLSQERIARCRLVNSCIKLLYDKFGNLTSPLSLFGFATLQADMRVPQSANGLLEWANFQPLLAYVNNVIKGQRTDDAWQELATGHGIQIERLRETIFMGNTAQGKWGRFATVASYSFSLGFDVLTGKYLTNDELLKWRAAEGVPYIPSEDEDGASSCASGSEEHGGRGEDEGSGARESDSDSDRSDFGFNDTVENAVRQFLETGQTDVTTRDIKIFLRDEHDIVIAPDDKNKFQRFVIFLFQQRAAALSGDGPAPAADGEGKEDGVGAADDSAAAPHLVNEIDATEVARQQRIGSTTNDFARRVLTFMCNPLLTTATPPHLTPLVMLYKEGKVDRSHILGEKCAITENCTRCVGVFAHLFYPLHLFKGTWWTTNLMSLKSYCKMCLLSCQSS